MTIDVRALSKLYGSQLALDHVSFTLNKNEVLGLLGPNGAGKTTLMKCITGATLPSEGDVFIDDLSVKEHPLKTKQKLGYLPENNPLYMDMYVREYLTFVTQIRNLPKDKIDWVIEKVGLTPESHKKISALSKGYKQRVGIAQAIIHSPEILILDEPTNGLDPNQILEIRQLIKEISHDKTIILSTHIMQEVEALCSRVVLLNKGKLIADESIEDFKGNYQNLEEAFHQSTL